jgi:hypothetical protein
MEINYWAVVACAVVAMVLGGIWYGPLFGRKWMEINGADPDDVERRKQMQKEAAPLYGVQFLLSLLQLYILAHFIGGWQEASGVETAVWIWLGFVMPTVAGLSMWTAQPSKVKWATFLISSGYQLVSFISFGFILSRWPA